MINGVAPISFSTLATYHPQFALAVLQGVALRPNLRTLQATFPNLAAGEAVPASFDQQISRYSVFAGCAVTIDPTNAFGGSSLKSMSDYFQAKVSGITLNLVIRSKGSDYAPIIDDIPLQLLEATLNPGAGTWKFDNPDNTKAQFTLQTPPTDSPFTVWVTFNLLVLGDGSQDYLCLDREIAQQKLVAHPMFQAMCAQRHAL
jgi:hypothetical protein